MTVVHLSFASWLADYMSLATILLESVDRAQRERGVRIGRLPVEHWDLPWHIPAPGPTASQSSTSG